jgi:hypothetical protein
MDKIQGDMDEISIEPNTWDLHSSNVTVFLFGGQ